jgi:hypothetical protein
VSGAGAPVRDIVEETFRLVGAAAEQNVRLRLLGGVAIRLHSSGRSVHPALDRHLKDIDFVTPRGEDRLAASFLESMGYEPNRTFNTMNAGRRALFYDVANERQLDLFVGSFEMCHVIPIVDRLDLEPVTIPLAELLLTKLQIIELNEKDQRDILALLLEHDVSHGDEETINSAHIARLCAADWGLWRTCKLNIERTRESIPSYGLTPAERELVSSRIEALRSAIDDEPKTRRWKLRDRVGDRVRWYEEPDEVGCRITPWQKATRPERAT